MEEKKKVIAYKYTPVRLPITFTIVWWLVLDRIHATELFWGIAGTLIVIVWIVSIIAMIKEEHCEPEWKDK